MSILYLFGGALLIAVGIVAWIDYQIRNYRWKAGRRYRRTYVPVAGIDYVLWLPDGVKRKYRKGDKGLWK